MTKITKKQEMINRYASIEGAKVINAGDTVIITYKQKNGLHINAVWYYNYNSRAIKPSVDAYRTEEEAKERLETIIKTTTRDQDHNKTVMANYAKQAETIQKGSILVSSWGYEQTNIDFYEVIERKGKTITLQPIGNELVESGDMVGKVIADRTNKTGETFRKRIDKYASANLTSYSSARIWDGTPQRFSSYA